jgi:hypothetical protein
LQQETRQLIQVRRDFSKIATSDTATTVLTDPKDIVHQIDYLAFFPSMTILHEMAHIYSLGNNWLGSKIGKDHGTYWAGIMPLTRAQSMTNAESFGKQASGQTGVAGEADDVASLLTRQDSVPWSLCVACGSRIFPPPYRGGHI